MKESTLPPWAKQDTETLILIYMDDDGNLHFQQACDLVYSGTLVDQKTGDDMPLVAWTDDIEAVRQYIIENDLM